MLGKLSRFVLHVQLENMRVAGNSRHIFAEICNRTTVQINSKFGAEYCKGIYSTLYVMTIYSSLEMEDTSPWQESVPSTKPNPVSYDNTNRPNDLTSSLVFSCISGDVYRHVLFRHLLPHTVIGS